MSGIGTVTDDEIVIPSTYRNLPVKNIGAYAFFGCNSLTSVTIPEGIVSINDSAFFGCNSLTSVTIPEGIVSINDSAFYDCLSLTSISLPESIENIGENAFYNCINLIEYEDGIGYVGEWVVACENPPENTTLREGTLGIGNGTFSHEAIEEITIPGGVKTIGFRAFYDCASLKSVTISEGVTTIGPSAFSECRSLTTLSLPDSISDIGSGAFQSCDLLNYNEYNGFLYLGNNTNPYVALVISNEPSVTSYDIHSQTKVICDYAFYRCTSLKDVTIPEGVKTVQSFAFYYCYALENVTIPDSVTFIGEAAFANCSALKEVRIGKGVATISSDVFAWCTVLESVTIQDSVTTIAEGAFANCTSLKAIYYCGTEEQWNAIEFGTENDCLKDAEVFYNCE